MNKSLQRCDLYPLLLSNLIVACETFHMIVNKIFWRRKPRKIGMRDFEIDFEQNYEYELNFFENWNSEYWITR